MRTPWIAALTATLTVQTVGTLLSTAIPVVAPQMTAELGLPPETIGSFASVNTLGAMLFLLFGTPLVARFGPARMLQWGTLAAGAAMLLALPGSPALLLAAALLMGIGYGPTGPAGSRVLQATAPPRHRVLVFSVKQAGAPAGGALAGLACAPLAAAFGWQWALAAAALAAFLAAAAIHPLRRHLDIERPTPVPLREAFGLRRLGAPLAALRVHPAMPGLVLLAFAYAALQGSLFTFIVTWLVEAHGRSLTAAGALFAAFTVAGVAGRLGLGFVADRVGDAMLCLGVQGVGAAVLTAGFVLGAPAAPGWLALALAAGCGFSAASWNGIFLAEVARLSPPDRVAEASSGAILLCFVGYLVAPVLFAAAVAWTASWTLPFLAGCGFLGAVAAWVLARRRRR